MTNSSLPKTSLNDSIENADRALGLCLCNKFKAAEDYINTLEHECMYHYVSAATISYLQAVFTFEQENIEAAYIKVKEASNLCDKFRKKHTWSETLHSLVGKPYFDDFSEVQLHAELCYAECLLERALLTFIQDENLVSFIKGGLKVRNAYNLYRNCLTALEQQPKLLAQSSNKADFDTGVYMGVGSFNVLLSLLPARILRLLEWVGFSGDRKKGMAWLHKGFELKGLRSPMCTITILLYQIVLAPILGLADTDVEYCNTILNEYLQKFPASSIFLYFSGRLKQTQGLLNEALSEYEQSVSVNIDWLQIHHICYWEMMWCHSFKGDWERAAFYAGKLASESKWSKSSYLYMEGSFLFMQYFEMLRSGDQAVIKEAEALKEKVEKLLTEVPKHKQRIAGKSVPFEKFAISRVEKYQETGIMVLPGIELVHIWNGFTMFKGHHDTIMHFLQLAKTAQRDIESRTFSNRKHKHDYVCLCKLIQGICLRHLKKTDEAEQLLLQVAGSNNNQHWCKTDCYLPPFASCELGFMYNDAGEYDKALYQLQHTLKHYSKYGLESRLHFRIHGGIESLKERNYELKQKKNGHKHQDQKNKKHDQPSGKPEEKNNAVFSDSDDEFFDVELDIGNTLNDVIDGNSTSENPSAAVNENFSKNENVIDKKEGKTNLKKQENKKELNSNVEIDSPGTVLPKSNVENSQSPKDISEASSKISPLMSKVRVRSPILSKETGL